MTEDQMPYKTFEQIVAGGPQNVPAFLLAATPDLGLPNIASVILLVDLLHAIRREDMERVGLLGGVIGPKADAAAMEIRRRYHRDWEFFRRNPLGWISTASQDDRERLWVLLRHKAAHPKRADWHGRPQKAGG